jgi:nucleoside-diphosphate-sugar epimerase
LSPLSPYSAAKAAASLWLGMMHRSHGLPAVILRPFLVYGPGQPPERLVPAAILHALQGRDFAMTEGRQSRELTYVDDVVEGFLRAGLRPAARGEAINLASGEERPVRDIVFEIYHRVGGAGRPRPGALPPRPNEMRRYVADTAKAARLLNWRATTPFADGLERTIAWARARGDAPLPLIPEAGR